MSIFPIFPTSLILTKMTRVRPVGPLAVDPLAADRLEARLGDPLAAPAAVHHLLARLLLPRKGAQMDL